MEAFQIPRRKVSRHFGIVRSAPYRRLHKVQDQKSASAPANKTPAEVASLVQEIIKDFEHLMHLCTEFESRYNACRPHMPLEGLRPDDVYYDRKPEKPSRDTKSLPSNIERYVFAETRLTAYRLKTAA